MPAQLTLSAEGSREARKLAAGTLTLGRAAENDWPLPDDAPEPTLSRRHCRISGGPDGFMVTDLGSTNGTRLNGRSVQAHSPTPLQSGDWLEVGPHRLSVEIGDLEAERAAAVPQAPASLLDDDPFALGARARPPAPRGPATGGPSLDELFSDWAPAPTPAPLTPTPMAITSDPLAALFSADLAPLPPSRPAEPDPTPEHRGGPQFEALTPRAHVVVEPASPQRAPSPPPPPLDDDPFGPGQGAAIAEPVRPVSEPPQAQVQDTMELVPAALPARRPVPDPYHPMTSPPAVPSGDAAELLAAFLEGAGLSARAVPVENSQAFFRDAGRAFGQLAEGLRELLAVRATVKDHARLDRTQIGAAQNNPLKFSINAREATAALLRRREEGYMAPGTAIEASFRDLKGHELALLEGLQSAVTELLAGFDPATLERRLADAGTLSLILQGGRRAKLWELYTERYEELARHAQARFMGHFDGAFRTAYERKSAEVAASPRLPADALGQGDGR